MTSHIGGSVKRVLRTPVESTRPDVIMVSRSIAAACCLASFLLLALHEPTATGSGSLATPCGRDATSTSIPYLAVGGGRRERLRASWAAAVRRLDVKRWALETRLWSGSGRRGGLEREAHLADSVREQRQRGDE